MKKLFTLGALALILSSCLEPVTITTVNPNEGKMAINIATNLETRVTDTAYEQGDRIGLFVVNEGENLSTWESHVTNMCFTLEGEKWTPDQPIYWKDKHTRAHFYAYYPYASVNNVNYHNFAVQQNQRDMNGYKASEFLWGKSEYQSPTDNAIDITTNHKMSLVRLALKAGKGFTFEQLRDAIQEVEINNVCCECTINLENGEIQDRSNSTTIYPCLNSSETNNGEQSVVYYALTVPQTVSNGSRIITIRIADDEYVVNLNRDYTFKAGKRHKLTINVDKINNGVNVGVGGWEEDDDEFWGDAE